MKQKFLLYLTLLAALLILAACSPARAAEPPVRTTPMNCPDPLPGTHQLIDADHGVCLLYLDSYDVFEIEGSGYTLYVESLLNTGAPVASIEYEPADGRVIEDILAEYLPGVDFSTVRFRTIGLDGATGYVLDELPGQDTNRRVIAIHNDQVINIMVARIGKDYGRVGLEAEALYQVITDSFRFIPIRENAPVVAGPECPTPVRGTTIYTNRLDRFCVLLPFGYMVDESLAGGKDSQTAVYVNGIHDTENPRLLINVTPSDGRSFQDITADRLAELEETLPGQQINWSFGTMIDGEPANRYDQLPGQDLSRQLLFVHDGRVYTLTFIPDDPAAGDVYGNMERLYAVVSGSFSFLHPQP